MNKHELLISHLRNYIDGKLELVPKSLGVLLVDTGFLNYQKLTPTNYDYWWYEVPDKTKINKNAFTYSWNDLVHTRKMRWIKQFIQYHKDNETIWGMINAILNIESALSDGLKDLEEIINIYYGRHFDKNKQLQMNF